MAELRNKYISFENFEGKTPLGRPRYKWEENIKMDLKEIWR
jgi:hypothetical protein